MKLFEETSPTPVIWGEVKKYVGQLRDGLVRTERKYKLYPDVRHVALASPSPRSTKLTVTWGDFHIDVQELRSFRGIDNMIEHAVQRGFRLVRTDDGHDFRFWTLRHVFRDISCTLQIYAHLGHEHDCKIVDEPISEADRAEEEARLKRQTRRRIICPDSSEAREMQT